MPESPLNKRARGFRADTLLLKFLHYRVTYLDCPTLIGRASYSSESNQLAFPLVDEDDIPREETSCLRIRLQFLKCPPERVLVVERGWPGFYLSLQPFSQVCEAGDFRFHQGQSRRNQFKPRCPQLQGHVDDLAIARLLNASAGVNRQASHRIAGLRKKSRRWPVQFTDSFKLRCSPNFHGDHMQDLGVKSLG